MGAVGVDYADCLAGFEGCGDAVGSWDCCERHFVRNVFTFLEYLRRCKTEVRVEEVEKLTVVG